MSRYLLGSKICCFLCVLKDHVYHFSIVAGPHLLTVLRPLFGISYRGFHAGCYFSLQLFSGLPIDRVHNLPIFKNRVRKNCDSENLPSKNCDLQKLPSKNLGAREKLPLKPAAQTAVSPSFFSGDLHVTAEGSSAAYASNPSVQAYQWS